MSRLQFILRLAVAVGSLLPLVDADKPTVEVLAVVDKTAWKAWEVHAKRVGNTVEEEINSVFKEVHKIYDPLGIKIRFQGDTFLKVDENILKSKNSYGNNMIEADQSTEEFYLWLQNQKDIKSFDAAVFIVGYDLAIGSDGGNGGWAYRTTACNNNAVAIVEGTFDMRMIVGIAHEIGHILGSYHDGEGNSCDSNDGYIMTGATDYTHPKFLTWSSCSKQSISDFLKTNQAKCLLDTTSSQIKGSRFGLIVDGDEACRRRFGESTYVSRINQAFDTCHALMCETRLVITETTITYDYDTIFTPAGMPCANGKLCNLSKCDKDSNGKSNLNENCLFGDTPYLSGAPWSDCKTVYHSQACSGTMASVCCASCSPSSNLLG